MDVETATLTSGDDGSVLDEKLTAKNVTFSGTFQSVSEFVTSLGLSTSVHKLSAVTNEAFSLSGSRAGQVVYLKPNITELTIDGLAEGVDYSVDKLGGGVTVLRDIAEDSADASGTYSTAESVQMSILNETGKAYSVLLDAAKEAGVRVELYKWLPAPAQSFSFNSGSEHTTVRITGKCAAVDSAENDPQLGQVGRFIYINQ